MKDERQSTPVDAPAAAVLSADALRVALGGRVRLARTAAGMSQQAVADAMSGYGFNWRQTTVAKVEAADRPTLFTEVVALSQILKRDLSFFLSGRTPLDDLKDELGRQTDDAQHSVKTAESALYIAKVQAEELETVEGIALAIVEYTYTGDTGPVLDSLCVFVGSPVFDLARCDKIFDAAGIPRDAVLRADRIALHEAALKVQEVGLAAAVDRPFGFTPEEAGENARKFVAGESTHPLFVRALRRERVWVTYVAQLLVDLIAECVELRTHMS